MTNEGKRNVSRVEFDNTYFAIEDDIENLIATNFGLKGEKFRKTQELHYKKNNITGETSAKSFHALEDCQRTIFSLH